MRLLHNVVNMDQLIDKFMRQFPDETSLLLDKVRVLSIHCACV